MAERRTFIDIVKFPPAWRLWRETAAIIEALTGNGGAARFVGGCVRDALIGLPTEDIDIATDLLPDTVVERLKASSIKALPTGRDHGTITAVIGKRTFEITTLRVDAGTDGRHADVVFTEDWEQDAERRDFTFNALYLDPLGELFDPMDGLPDLETGHVRFIGRADDRIAEDRLRVLRYFRFVARFDDANPEKDALIACRNAAKHLGSLSAERIQKELLLLLATTNPVRSLDLMQKTGVLAAVIGRSFDLSSVTTLLSLPIRSNTLQRFAALMGADAEAAIAVADKLKLPNRFKKRLMAACGNDLTPDLSATERDISLYHLGRQAFIDQTILLWAKLASDMDMSDYLRQAETWRAPQLPVTGHDLLDLGIAEGEDMGRLLKKIEKCWVSSGFKLTKPELLELCLSRSADP